MKKIKLGLFTGLSIATSLAVPLVSVQHNDRGVNANAQFSKQVQIANAQYDNIDTDLWEHFIGKINDHSTDWASLNLSTGWTLTLHTKLIASKFYRENIPNKALKARTEFPAIFMNLFLSSEFTEVEKVIIGKRILNSVATKNYLKNIGLYDVENDDGSQKNIVTPEELYNKTGKVVMLKDKPLLFANTQLPIEGKTGYYKDWEITHPNFDRLFIVSNQDALNDFQVILTHTKKYVELLKFTHDIQTKFFATDSSKVTLVEAWNQFESKVFDVLSTINIDPTAETNYLSFIEGFEIFHWSELPSNATSSDAYEKILSSSLGKSLFGVSDAVNKEIEAFKMAPNIVKLSKMTVLFSNIFEKLKYLILDNDYIRQFAKAKLTISVDKSDDPSLLDYVFNYIEDTDIENMLTKFAGKICKESGYFIHAMKINVINDFELGDAIVIQRFDQKNWKYLNNLPTRFWNVSDSVLQTKQNTPANLVLSSERVSGKWELVKQFDKNASLTTDVIKINEGKPVGIGGNEFYLSLEIKANGFEVKPWTNFVHLHDLNYSNKSPKNYHETEKTMHTYEGGADYWMENNHSDYPKVIHVTIPSRITSTYTVKETKWDDWTIKVNNIPFSFAELDEKLEGTTKLYFTPILLSSWSSTYIPIEIKDFNKNFKNAIREVVLSSKEEFTKLPSYNPLSTYKIEIIVKDINVGRVFFDKNSNVTIKNLELLGINAIFGIDIYEQK